MTAPRLACVVFPRRLYQSHETEGGLTTRWAITDGDGTDLLEARPGDLLVVDRGGVLAEVVAHIRLALDALESPTGNADGAVGGPLEYAIALLASVPPQAPARRGQGGGEGEA